MGKLNATAAKAPSRMSPDAAIAVNTEDSDSDSSSSSHKPRRPDSDEEVQNKPVKICLNNTIQGNDLINF